VPEKLSGVVATETKGCLGKIVGAKAKEVSLLRNFVCGESSAGDLNHRSNYEGKVYGVFFHHSLGCFFE
jgi:hypothetical protein